MRYRRAWWLVGIVCLGVADLFTLGWTKLTQDWYLPSARDNLNAFAALPTDTSFDEHATRQALLRQLPLGTSEDALVGYLDRWKAVSSDSPTLPGPRSPSTDRRTLARS